MCNNRNQCNYRHTHFWCCLIFRCFRCFLAKSTEQPSFVLTSEKFFLNISHEALWLLCWKSLLYRLMARAKEDWTDIVMFPQPCLKGVLSDHTDLIKQVFDAGWSFEHSSQASFFLLKDTFLCYITPVNSFRNYNGVYKSIQSQILTILLLW